MKTQGSKESGPDIFLLDTVPRLEAWVDISPFNDHTARPGFLHSSSQGDLLFVGLHFLGRHRPDILSYVC